MKNQGSAAPAQSVAQAEAPVEVSPAVKTQPVVQAPTPAPQPEPVAAAPATGAKSIAELTRLAVQHAHEANGQADIGPNPAGPGQQMVEPAPVSQPA